MVDQGLFEEYAELVSRFKTGSVEAYEEIYKKSERMVYTICYGILNNEEDAFDAMQETYLTVYKKIDSLEDNKTFVSWLKRIATTKSLDAYKKKKGDVSYDDAVAADESLQLDDNLETLPDAYIMEKTKREALDKIIRDELTDVQYQTIHMHYYSQMSVEQIAEIMNCPVGTVKTRLKSSRAKIKEGVKKYEKENKDAFAATPTAGVPFLTRFFNASSDNLRVPNLNIATLIGEQASNVTPTVVETFTKLASNDSVKDVAKGGLLTTTAAKVVAGLLIVAVPVAAGLGIKRYLDRNEVPVETSVVVIETSQIPTETPTPMPTNTPTPTPVPVIELSASEYWTDYPLSDVITWNMDITHTDLSVYIQRIEGTSLSDPSYGISLGSTLDESYNACSSSIWVEFENEQSIFGDGAATAQISLDRFLNETLFAEIYPELAVSDSAFIYYSISDDGGVYHTASDGSLNDELPVIGQTPSGYCIYADETTLIIPINEMYYIVFSNDADTAFNIDDYLPYIDIVVVEDGYQVSIVS